MIGHFELKNVGKGGFGFNLKAANGAVIFTSGAYQTRESALAGIDAVKASAPNDTLFERKIAKNHEPYFVLKALNGEVLGRSEMYSSHSAMENGIKSVVRNAPEAKVTDLTTAEPLPV